MIMDNEMFKFIKGLDAELYYRYLDIDQMLGSRSGLVYVAMQIYLESLIRFVVEIEGIEVGSASSLGTYLRVPGVQNFFLLDLEYNNLDELSMINSYANGIKHIKYDELDPNKFMIYIKELYEISKTIYLLYCPEQAHVVREFDIRYYEDIVCIEKRKSDRIEELEEENKELEMLHDEVARENKRLLKEQRAINRELNQIQDKSEKLQTNNQILQEELIRFKTDAELLRIKVSDLETECVKSSKDIKRLTKIKNKFFKIKEHHRLNKLSLADYKARYMELETKLLEIKEENKRLMNVLQNSKQFIRQILNDQKRLVFKHSITRRENQLKFNIDLERKFKMIKFKPSTNLSNKHKKVFVF